MKSLEGKVIAITRNNKEAFEFSQLVNSEGGKAIPLSTIDIVPERADVAKKFIDKLSSKKYDYCAFMSAQAIEVLLRSVGIDQLRSVLHLTKVIAVGPKTRAALENLDIRVDFVPAEFSSKGMVKMLDRLNTSGKKIIIPRSAAADDYVVTALQSIGMEVDEVRLYRVKTSRLTKEWKQFSELLLRGKVDCVIFTSASTVGSFFEMLGKLLASPVDINRITRVISIGPFTTRELKKRKIGCSEAKVHTVRGSVDLARNLLSE